MVPSPVEPVKDIITGLPIQFGKYAEKRYPISDPLIIEFLELVLKVNNYQTEFLTTESDKSIRERSVDHLILWHLLLYPKQDNFSWDLNSILKTLKENPRLLLNYLKPSTLKKEISYLGASTGGVASERIIYIPTMAYKMLKMTRNSFPNRHLIFNDFDHLPESMHGKNAPLVQRTVGNETKSYNSYVDAEMGLCDIFFPTDFDMFHQMYRHLYNQDNSTILQTRHFMKQWADVKKTKTRFFYNPLLHDFINTKFFLS